MASPAMTCWSISAWVGPFFSSDVSELTPAESWARANNTGWSLDGIWLEASTAVLPVFSAVVVLGPFNFCSSFWLPGSGRLVLSVTAAKAGTDNAAANVTPKTMVMAFNLFIRSSSQKFRTGRAPETLAQWFSIVNTAQGLPGHGWLA